MDESAAIAEFCRLLGRVRSRFRDAHISVEKQRCFANVETGMSPYETSVTVGRGEYVAVGMSLSIHGDLKHPIDDKCSFGATVDIAYGEGEWQCEGSIGWSTNSDGWEEQECLEMTAQSADELRSALEDFTQRTLDRFAALVEANAVRGWRWRKK